MAERWLAPDEIARALSLTPRAVRAMCARGELPGAVKLGRLWRVPSARFEDYQRRLKADQQQVVQLRGAP